MHIHFIVSFTIIINCEESVFFQHMEGSYHVSDHDNYRRGQFSYLMTYILKWHYPHVHCDTTPRCSPLKICSSIERPEKAPLLTSSPIFLCSCFSSSFLVGLKGWERERASGRQTECSRLNTGIYKCGFYNDSVWLSAAAHHDCGFAFPPWLGYLLEYHCNPWPSKHGGRRHPLCIVMFSSGDMMQNTKFSYGEW